jgi:DNA-binding MarR family transcriptional regulator
MDFSFIRQLLDFAEGFSEQNPGSTDMNLFARWLDEQTSTSSTKQKFHLPEMTPTETVESVIAKILIFLNRYARTYLKKALENTKVNSLDEFVFLVNLTHRGSVTKMELIERSRLDKPIGMEVWRRLLSAGFVEQETHETDKRSKKMTLTPAGKEALFGSIEVMNQVVGLLSGNLTQNEKLRLLELLQKLEDFHLPIRQATRNCSWEETLEIL